MLDEEVIQKAIGKRIKELRIDAGFTSYENFAFEHELSARYYWGVENGRNISIRYLLILLTIFNLGIKDFFLSLEIE